jgi:hypothetical protein
MSRLVSIAALVAGLSILGAPAALAGGPVSKQNGTTPVFRDFTSICSVSGYLNYGNCGGDATTYGNVTGRINAVQAKLGRWNLGVSFKNLQPGALYRLWGNQDGAVPSAGEISGFFPIATAVAGLDGSASFSYQTSTPSGLGFDLNILDDITVYRGITVVTSYWSEQAIKVMNPDGSLYVPGS